MAVESIASNDRVIHITIVETASQTIDDRLFQEREKNEELQRCHLERKRNQSCKRN